MGITIAEFRVAMETYGAKRLPDREGTRYNVLVPCFSIGNVDFRHSGSYYVVQWRTPQKIMDKAMAELGEKHPGGDNFWWGEIHSVKGMLTLAAMLEGKYSKELIDELVNTTYKKLLECSLIQKNVEIPFRNIHSSKMVELCKKLDEYSNIVNPFGNETVELKEPKEYIDSLKFSIAFKEGETPYVRLNVEDESSCAKYSNDSEGWCYDTKILIQNYEKNSYISLVHYYTNGTDHCPIDEVVYLNYKVNAGSYEHHPDDIDLRISLKTGLAWKTYKEKQAAPTTDEQIDIIITYLNTCIKKIKQRIISYMISK